MINYIESSYEHLFYGILGRYRDKSYYKMEKI